MWRLAGLGATALVLLAAGLWIERERIVLGYLGGQIPKTDIEARAALIEPAMTFSAPEGVPPPWPVVLQFHGCAGIRPPFMTQWAREANEAGYLAVVVDSNGPRGIDRERALKHVCAGDELIGQERAGDVLAAIDIVSKRSDVDETKIVLAGWSHGGWSVMDLIAMTPPRRTPAGLKDVGAAPPDIAGAILVYPYCGRGSWTRLEGWRRPVPTLALVAGADTVVDPSECPATFARLAEDGAEVDVVVYPQADHVFDDPYLAPQDQHMYNEAAHHDAARRYRAFLERIAKT